MFLKCCQVSWSKKVSFEPSHFLKTSTFDVTFELHEYNLPYDFKFLKDYLYYIRVSG